MCADTLSDSPTQTSVDAGSSLICNEFGLLPRQTSLSPDMNSSNSMAVRRHVKKKSRYIACHKAAYEDAPVSPDVLVPCHFSHYHVIPKCSQNCMAQRMRYEEARICRQRPEISKNPNKIASMHTLRHDAMYDDMCDDMYGDMYDMHDDIYDEMCDLYSACMTTCMMKCI